MAEKITLWRTSDGATFEQYVDAFAHETHQSKVGEFAEFLNTYCDVSDDFAEEIADTILSHYTMEKK